MCPTSNALGALRVAAVGGAARVRIPAAGPGSELVRALDVAVRVMADANDRMAEALATNDLAGYEQASLRYDTAERRYDELWAAASDAGYLLVVAAVPDKPAKLGRFTGRDRLVRRLAGRLRHPLRAAAAH